MIAFDLIGQTPLYLESFSDENVQIYAKLEQFNPGSVKDRLGKYLVETAIKEGRVSSGT